MNNQEKPRGPHSRANWSEMRSDTIFVSVKYSDVKNGASGDRGSAKSDKDAYIAAKQNCDHDAATVIVDKFFSDRVLDRLIDELSPDISAGKRICIIHPQPGFNRNGELDVNQIVTNALPYACAELLAEEIGADITNDIMQVARPGRTKLNRWQRFLYQPKFEGAVDADAVYVLVDDNSTMGGTLAMLRTHIVDNGGTIGAVCTLCSPDGVDCKFSIAKDTVNVINSRYGDEIDIFLLKEIGHETLQLTENEGLSLARWDDGNPRIPVFERFRERIRATRSGSE